MLNQVVLVGRLVTTPEIKELESGKKFAKVVLAVSRSFNNEEGVYETDFIDCVLYNNIIAESTAEYCRKGDLIGIRGRLETNTYEDANGDIRKTMQVICDKVSFLATNKGRDE